MPIDYAKLEEFKKKISEKNSVKVLMGEIRDLLAELVAIQYSKEDGSTITEEERKPYMDPESDKFKMALESLKAIATKKKDGDTTFILLFRGTEDLEYQAAKDGKQYNTKALAKGEGSGTNWFISRKGADSKRITKNPLVQCMVPTSDIIGFIFPPSEKSSPTGIGDDKFEDVVEVTVKPGSYKIEQEYLGDN